MNSIPVGEAADYLESHPECFKIIYNANPKTAKANATFQKVQIDIKGNVSGLFSVDSFRIMGIPDPNNPMDKRNLGGTSNNISISTRISMCGDLGRFIKVINKLFNMRVTELIREGKLPNKKINSLISDKYSMNHKTNPGGINPDPYCNLKIDPFNKYPSTMYPDFLADKVKTVIKNIDLATTTDKGLNIPSEFINPKTKVREQFTRDNIHLFLTSGTTLLESKLLISAISNSSYGYSLGIHILQSVAKSNIVDGFSDTEAETSRLLKYIGNPQKTIEPNTTKEESSDGNGKDLDELNDMLEQMN